MSTAACTALLQRNGRRVQCGRTQGHYEDFVRERKLAWPTDGNPAPDGWHASGDVLWGDFSSGALPSAGPVRPDEETT